MSAPVSPQPSQAPRRGVKIKAGIVTALVLLVVAAGLWFVYSQLFAGPSVDKSQYESNDTPAAEARARFFDQPTTNPTAEVTLRKDGSGEVRLGGAISRFTQSKAGINVAFFYQDLRFVPPEYRQANAARFIAMANPSASSNAKVTAEQLQKLHELTPPSNVPLSDASKSRLLDLWSQYGKAADADRPAVRLKLEEQLRQLAADGIDPATRAYEDYASKIRTILTPDQVAELRMNRFLGNRPRPPQQRP